MGGMPFHLEKGVMGLRFDYLMRCPLVRQFMLAQLQPPGADPLAIAKAISIPRAAGGAPILINALADTMPDFMARLTDLFSEDSTQLPDDEEHREAYQYDHDNQVLDTRNQDTGGNRLAFVGYWTLAIQNDATITGQIRAAMLKAINAVDGPEKDRARIDHWWDCTLIDGEKPRVICSLDVPSVARIFFCTPHKGAVETHERNVLPARPPFDPPGPNPRAPSA